MLKVLFLCTENACRSQMAEGLVNHYLAGKVQAFSAGTAPTRVNPRALQVMAEMGIDIRGQRSKSIDDLAGERFDLVITVCDQAREQCPLFSAKTPQLHVSFPDPARASGSAAEILAAFRRVALDMKNILLPLLEKEYLKKAGAQP
jgi:arsenate reductase